MASLQEQNVYSPSISTVDPNNDVANLQLANRTLYLKVFSDNLQTSLNQFKSSNNKDITDLQSALTKAQNDIKTLSNTSSAIDEKSILQQLTDINTAVTKLQNDMLTHTHNYAASSRPSGDASTVDVVEDSITSTFLVGTSAINSNKLRRNMNISMEDGNLTSKTFTGDLVGVADSAKTLYYKPKITLSGDVVGSIDFTGDKDIVINTSLKEQGVSAGEYGAVGNYTLSTGGSFTVPDITVNNVGTIVKIRNRTVSLPANMAVNGITSSLSTEKRIYVLGASEQSEHAAVYSQNGVYVEEHVLYSNSKEVINDSDFQNLKNKTYEGYELADACARGVDETIGGTKDDNRLVTSTSLARHKHKYAVSDSLDGKALYVKVTEDEANKLYVVGNNDTQGSLCNNKNVYLKDNGLFSKDLTATDNMYIPGGKIWIESVEVPVDDNAWSGNADISYNTNNYVKATRDVKLADGLSVFEGVLLAYQANGYILADNHSEDTCDNVVLTAMDGLNGSVKVVESGVYDLGSYTHDGENCYVGEKGEIVFGSLDTQGLVCKKIGYVEGTNLIFRPGQYAIYKK